MTADAARPLVVLGIDAGDPVFIERWAAEGRLPNIAALMERGAWGVTGGAELLSEHGVWISLLSGVSRRDHGYYYFRQLKPGTYELETVTGLELDAPPFWAELRASAARAAIIDVPDMLPLEGLEGVQLCNWATHNNWGREHYRTCSRPSEALARVARELGPRLVAIEDEHAPLAEDRRLRHQLLEQTELKGRACRLLLAGETYDLVVAVFATSHVANHQFWKYQPDLPEGTADDELLHAIRDVYAAIDREIGRVLETVRRDANVVVVSSVGMEDDYPTTGVTDAFFRQLGYQPLPAATRASLRPLDLARRLTPERWRIAVSRHFPTHVRERLLADGFRTGSDWSRTTAFAVPAAYTSFVRVNLRGREPEGIVEPGRAYDALLTGIEADLRQLVDTASGEPAVVRTVRTVDAFGCEPHASLPDLFVEWRPGSFLRRIRHPRAELVQGHLDFNRRSDHSSNGFVAAAGPDVRRRGRIDTEVDILSLAPTFLSLLGRPVPERMRGEALHDLLA